jgi:hypothetical protein
MSLYKGYPIYEFERPRTSGTHGRSFLIVSRIRQKKSNESNPLVVRSKQRNRLNNSFSNCAKRGLTDGRDVLTRNRLPNQKSMG